jgi:hypothetical protein
MVNADYSDTLNRSLLLCWVEEMERPALYKYLGLYSNWRSVDRAKALIKAMDNNVVITAQDCIEALNDFKRSNQNGNG